VREWWIVYQDGKVTAGDLFPLAEDIGFDFGTGNDRARKIRFGTALAKQRDRRYGDLKVEGISQGRHGAAYRLTATAGKCGECFETEQASEEII
jgi:hypothetical protein